MSDPINNFDDLIQENIRLKTRIGELEAQADLSWKRDHVVLGGKWHAVTGSVMRADEVQPAIDAGTLPATAHLITVVS